MKGSIYNSLGEIDVKNGQNLVWEVLLNVMIEVSQRRTCKKKKTDNMGFRN
jgi:hypothetical protein